jgi:hypothetical protein
MQQHGWGSDIAWGAKRGLGVAFVYCAWVSVVYLIGGSTVFAKQEVTYATLVATYLGIGLISGISVGALRRFTNSVVGAYAVGIVAGIPVAVGIAICVKGLPSHWGEYERVAIPFFSVAAGLVIGSEMAKRARQVTSTTRR